MRHKNRRVVRHTRKIHRYPHTVKFANTTTFQYPILCSGLHTQLHYKHMDSITYPPIYTELYYKHAWYISYNNVRHVDCAYSHDLYHLSSRWTKNIGSASCISTEFVYTQFALQWLYTAIQFALTQCALQECKYVSPQFLSKQFPLVHTDTGNHVHW